MKLGFIGAGNMGTAILKGVLESGFLKPEEIAVFDVNQEQSIRFAGGKPVRIAETEEALVEGCERILLAVKPIYMNDVLQKVGNVTKIVTLIDNIDQPNAGTTASSLVASPMVGNATAQPEVQTPVAIDPDQGEPVNAQ